MQSKIKTMREANGWSQEQLAQMAGLSTRTIQRIERGQRAGLESWKALAAVFNTTISQLQGENPMEKQISQVQQEAEEAKALADVRRLRGWYLSLIRYAVIIPFLALINLLSSPDYWWVLWPAAGWGLGLALRGLMLLGPWALFDDTWERRQVEKRIGRKL